MGPVSSASADGSFHALARQPRHARAVAVGGPGQQHAVGATAVGVVDRADLVEQVAFCSDGGQLGEHRVRGAEAEQRLAGRAAASAGSPGARSARTDRSRRPGPHPRRSRWTCRAARNTLLTHGTFGRRRSRPSRARRRAGAPARSPAALGRGRTSGTPALPRPRRPSRSAARSTRRCRRSVRRSGRRATQLGQHLRRGVGRDHVVAEREDRLGELAGAGAELEDASGTGADQPG